ncbi:glyoxalase [Mycobacterium paraseoulense]|uniref:Glyoxalase n=1 Tax=Mycobacterium paraseoulense TaxID=590652 RepID=A0A1X0I865_9MYCO|nr:glyoxalase [Mycobacterium paraseoulense]MCV7393978.1 VOC family protein [Mycobacterium paraseoulense]ORB38407.1 glyoxalase [Mycobacterium paraseoulense]BBZ70390.1 hypothetical protein MPRS_14830 [Mycobacterium paraseoulense]
MGSDNLARRFLHVNLNCDSLDAAERLYAGRLGLSPRMRTDPTVATDGTILGMDGEAYCTTSFLYDTRGPRAGCALEAIEFDSPALVRDHSADPVRPGIRSMLMWVMDLEAAVGGLRADGFAVGDPVDGLISGTKSVLAVDPDGAIVEIAQRPVDVKASEGTLFSGIRIMAIDALATREFFGAIGFVEVEAPARREVASEQLAPYGSAEPLACVVARFALPEDAHQFTVVLVQHPHTAQTPVPWGGNRQGLYRCALRVEDVEKALAEMPDSVERMGDPVWCPLPGTKIDGLKIAFLRSPDGVIFELVERPLKLFSR